MMAVRTCQERHMQASASGAALPAALPVGSPVTSVPAPQSCLVNARPEPFAATKNMPEGGSS